MACMVLKPYEYYRNLEEKRVETMKKDPKTHFKPPDLTPTGDRRPPARRV